MPAQSNCCRFFQAFAAQSHHKSMRNLGGAQFASAANRKQRTMQRSETHTSTSIPAILKHFWTTVIRPNFSWVLARVLDRVLWKMPIGIIISHVSNSNCRRLFSVWFSFKFCVFNSKTIGLLLRGERACFDNCWSKCHLFDVVNGIVAGRRANCLKHNCSFFDSVIVVVDIVVGWTLSRTTVTLEQAKVWGQLFLNHWIFCAKQLTVQLVSPTRTTIGNTCFVVKVSSMTKEKQMLVGKLKIGWEFWFQKQLVGKFVMKKEL